VAEAAFTNNVAWPRSDPDVSSPDQIQENATCGERLGTAHNIMRSVALRQCDDFVTIRAGDLAVTTIRPWQREKATDVLRAHSLQSSSKPPISESPVRSTGWAALCLLVRTLRPHRPRALYRNLSCQGLRELSIDWLFYTQREGSSMRINGTVKFFNGAKGFGFISPADGSKDVFVHATALERAGIRSLNEGDKVSFVLEDDRKGRGKQAAQIELA